MILTDEVTDRVTQLQGWRQDLPDLGQGFPTEAIVHNREYLPKHKNTIFR